MKIVVQHSRNTLTIFTCMILSILMFTACDSRPDYVLDKKDMASLVVDVHKGESLIDINHNQFSTDTTRRILKQSVLDAHGVTQEQWDSSLAYYGRNVEEYIEMYDMAIEELEKQLKNANVNVQGADMQIQVAGDSADIWDQPKLRHFSSIQPTDIMKFNIRRDMNWDRGDVYTWSFKGVNGKSPISWTIAAEYSDGTSEYKSGTATSEGWNAIVFHTDSARTTASLRGILQLHPGVNESVYLDSIALVRTRHEKAPAGSRIGVKEFYNKAIK
ncbi:MAG: DUF4296 domain-containing protein [Muribaculum sp.]|nr:DUF4296 domain-containing protein [Muribaculaceae bacterium]MCM1081711.1 DUF4296 domain-containing protein [Muribaculum sp.]